MQAVAAGLAGSFQLLCALLEQVPESLFLFFIYLILPFLFIFIFIFISISIFYSYLYLYVYSLKFIYFVNIYFFYWNNLFSLSSYQLHSLSFLHQLQGNEYFPVTVGIGGLGGIFFYTPCFSTRINKYFIVTSYSNRNFTPYGSNKVSRCLKIEKNKMHI